MTIRLFLFGSPAVDYGGESLALPFERRNQLLAFLALKRSWVARAELAALLWPEQENKLAYTNLRKTLHRLQSLPWARGIESQGGALRFEAETDVVAFDSALREQRLADALPMRRGEFLAGFDDGQSEAWSSWLNFERDRLQLAWRDAALNRLGVDIDVAEGIDLSARLLDADPLDEDSLRAHMSWLARGGQSARARHAYHDFVKRLEDDLGLAPGAELRALHDSLGTKVGSAAPAASMSTKADETFVGRAVELRRIGTLLAQDTCRLITLMGPGGVGKTRLARRAMHEFASQFADGALFIPLEDMASVAELGGRLARELGVSLVGSSEPIDQIVAFLCERQVLLVLDNFEHLATDTSILSRLLDACSRLKFIVTSRVRLGLGTEFLLPLEGLPCPEVEDQDRFEAFDAVRLFIQAAQRVEPALVPAVEAAAIVDICKQVEGLPLALELAAAWTRVLPCDAIATELRQGTALLQAVDATQPARHASIDVVFDQSWRLLGATERDALARLSIFHGGFSPEAARTVAGALLPVLGALVDKSLLRKDGARIFFHPLVHQLAAVRLGNGEIRNSTEEAHALYFYRLLAQLQPAVCDGDRAALQSIDAEFENCRLAWRWSIAHGQGDALTRSVTSLIDYCDHRGRFVEGLSLLREFIGSTPIQEHAKLHALLLSKASHLEFRLDRYADAEATAKRALDAALHTRDAATKIQSLTVLASCGLRMSRLADARRFYKRALALAPENTRAHSKAATLDNLALVEKQMGHYDEALRLSLESLVQHRYIGDTAGEALCLNSLGGLYLAKQEYGAADAHLRAGLAICDRDGLISTRGYILANLSDVALKTGDLDAADSYIDRALEVMESVGAQGLPSALKLQRARLAVRRGDLDAARSALEAGLRIAIAIGNPSLKLAGIMCFAEMLEAQHELSQARRLMAFAANHPSISAPVRDEILAQLARMPVPADADSARPNLDLDELVHRIVVETHLAHAPLIATLRGSR